MQGAGRRRPRRGGDAIDVGGTVEGAGVEAAGEEPDRGGCGKGTGQRRRTEDAGRAGRGGGGRSAECGGRREEPRQYIQHKASVPGDKINRCLRGPKAPVEVPTGTLGTT